MKNIKQIHKGITLAFAASVISGIAIFYSKISVVKIDPLILATARNSYVGIIFLLLFLLTNNLKQISKLSKKELLTLLIIGIVGGSISFYLFFSGIKLIGAQSANMIHKSLFIWVAILGIFTLKEKVKVNYIITGVLVCIGTYFFAPFTPKFGKGEQLVLIATIFWSIENVLAKKILSKTSSELVALFRMVVGGVILVLITLFSGKGKLLIGLNFMQWKTIFVGGSILFFYVFTWYRALKYAPISLVSLILTFSLVVGNMLSVSFTRIPLLKNDLYTTICIVAAMGVLIIPFIKKFRLFIRPHE
ncbi:hypothetical protein COY87_03195 [Candidatus Roizmanbacteria bacterium CG_4_10_14_0_8_um_filter_33_9]|uniref:EamA domain-containing protein n=1 Tax=Candidatus Roizmanbacteria bacterium CG_4_10_14_0_8_um_filter_33_9 TaxID=1974826 RepID=A0A2M7QI53_9BACT|nr:MAG: hypothetical protein COY87_03195 [Candidatus Roizmanbacteria bacterium CG_4_10_14_0_8_um_filter_33_9]